MHTEHSISIPNRAPLQLGQTALVMGILNVTPDSFSDGGTHNLVDAALAHARVMIDEGVDIIDIGGESTRPGAEPVGVQQELDRVMPVLDAIRAAGITTPISIDTYKALVADQAIQAGATIINDVRGLQGDPDMADVAALYNVPIIVMHWPNDRVLAENLTEAMRRYFDATFARADAAGIVRTSLILDPGFGFGKSLTENYTVLGDLAGCCTGTAGGSYPILVGTSRKSMIGRLLDRPASERLAGTIATNILGYINGGHIFRVHDVRANRDALRVAQATLYGPPAHLG